MVKAVVFDFDGVIVRQSEFFKEDAWTTVFAPYGDRAQSALQKAKETYGNGLRGDRYDILRATYEGLGEPASRIPELVAKGAAVFDAEVQKKIADVSIEPDTRATLVALSKRLPLYLNSATPVDALARTVATLGIRDCFAGVLGRPNTKVENFKEVAEREHAEPEEILFIGDAESDRESARVFGCRFLGFANAWNGWDASMPFPIITSLTDAERFL